ncbi:hypothetical protein [Salinarchaeum laminariae]|uniref:hypothetical protein n=1 Tax=Salinarchaeum laminariae TaxID=869888 RepID=UPI0020C10094|nr:hypothetical protein [Salinarchaeum laminariae]
MSNEKGAEISDSLPRLDLHRRRLIRFAGAACGAGVLGTGTVAGNTDLTQSSSSEPELITASPEDGFNYPYYLYTPGESRSGSTPLLVEPNNTGTSTNDFEEHRKSAQGIAQNGFSRDLSDDLSIPFLVPVFPRPSGDPVDYTHYVHALDAQTMAIEDGPLERVDQQLLAMVDDARDRLATAGFQVTDQLMLNGFSASGTFVNRFAALHPNRVTSVTAGGINGTAILPAETAKGHELNYHIGIANVEQMTGEPFDLEAWQGVDQLAYMGGEDENDTIPYSDAWSDSLREVALDVYGENMQEDRMMYCADQYEEAGATGRVNVYPGVGHQTTSGIREDMRVFHRKHLNEFFVRFGTAPGIGTDAVDIIASAGSSSDTNAFEIRAFDASGEDLTGTSASLESGGGIRTSLPLNRALEPGETVTIGVLMSGDVDQSDAYDTETTSARAGVSFTASPTAGDSTVDVSYTLDSVSEGNTPVTLWVTTEQGGAVAAKDLNPGADGETTVDLPEEENGVLLEQGREVTVGLARGNPVDGTRLADETRTVAEPEEVALDVTLSTDPVAERGSNMAVEVAVQSVGGSASDLPLVIALNGTTVATDTVAVELGETTTISFDVSVEGVAGTAAHIAAGVAEATESTTIMIADEPSAGSGTESDPYEVSHAGELASISLEPDGHFLLTEDIELAPFSQFPRIGSSETPFSGSLDGQYHEIRNLRVRIDQSQFDGAGLLGNLQNGSVRNLHLLNVDVRGGDFTGGLVGMASEGGQISRVTVSGIVDGASNVGGVIGGTSTGVDPEADVVISETVSHADVQGESKVAGILGQSSGDPVHNSVAAGSVQGSNNVAGIVAWVDFGGLVTTSYTRAPLSGSGGGVVAHAVDGDVEDVYWDVETTGMQNSAEGGTGLETGDMMGGSAHSTMDGLDFQDTWEAVDDDYPQLREITHPQDPAWSVVISEPGLGETVPEDEELTVAMKVVNAGTVAGSTTVTLEQPDLDQTVDVSADAEGETEATFNIPAEHVEPNSSITVAVDGYQHTRTLSAGEAPVVDDTSPGEDDDTSTDTNNTDTSNSTSTTEPKNTTSERINNSTSSANDQAEDEATPGFGLVGTIAAIIGTGRILQRRNQKQDE